MDAEVTTAKHVLEYLNSIGTVGLALIVWALWTGRLITRREFDLCAKREADFQQLAAHRELDLQQRLDKALNIGGRATETSQTLVDRLPTTAIKS